MPTGERIVVHGYVHDQLGRPLKNALVDRRLDNGAAVYRFDIHLQGENETVFFDVRAFARSPSRRAGFDLHGLARPCRTAYRRDS